MAIAFDSATVANDEGTTPSPFSFNHTCSSGSNRLLLVGVSQFGGDTVTGITYNGVAMTQLVKTTAAWGGPTGYIYGLLNPASGTNAVAVSWTGGNDFTRCSAGSYTGVKQTGLPDATAHNENATAAQTSIAATITTVADNSWVGVYSLAQNGTFSSLTNGTIRQSSGPTMWGDSNGAVTPAGMDTLTSNFASSGQQCILLASFAPAISGGGFFNLL